MIIQCIALWCSSQDFDKFDAKDLKELYPGWLILSDEYKVVTDTHFVL